MLLYDAIEFSCRKAWSQSKHTVCSGPSRDSAGGALLSDSLHEKKGQWFHGANERWRGTGQGTHGVPDSFGANERRMENGERHEPDGGNAGNEER